MTNDDDRRDAAEAKYQRWIGSLPRDQFDLHMMGCRAYERRGIERAAAMADAFSDMCAGSDYPRMQAASTFAASIAAAIRAITTEEA